jgi:topoisomerase-4 subunit A
MGKPKDLILLASDAGYGFVTEFENFYSKNKAGKALLRCPKGALVLRPQWVQNFDEQYLAAATTEGRMLLFPLALLPQLPKGKGNKIIGIPSARVAAREEYCTAIALIDEGAPLTLYSGKRHITIKWKDLAHYQGERGRRGMKLPRGFRKVDSMFSESTS